MFPATYDFSMNSDAKVIVDKMLAAFDDRLSDKVTAYCKENNMSLYQFITLCSIVQEEALSDDSAANIASVLINRLNKGSKLQCDVTYFYAKNCLITAFLRKLMILITHTDVLRFRADL